MKVAVSSSEIRRKTSECYCNCYFCKAFVMQSQMHICYSEMAHHPTSSTISASR